MLASLIVLAVSLGPATEPVERQWPPIQRPDGMKPGAPAPSQPSPVEPAPVEPDPTEPDPTEPDPTEPDPTEPAPIEPAPVEPAPSQPEPTEPAPGTEPTPTQPGTLEPITVPEGPSEATTEEPEWMKTTRPEPEWMKTTRPPPPPPPEPRRSPSVRADRPQETGRGMIIAAGALGGTGLLIKAVGTGLAIQSSREGRPFGDPTLVYVSAGIFYNPVLGGSLALLGGGMAKRGRLLAREDRSLPVDPIPGVGWGLFGTGVGIWAITRVVGLTSCGPDACRVALWEGGYYASLALTVPGMALGARASGYRRQGSDRRTRRRAALTVSPVRARGAWGLGLAGRF